MEAEIRRAGGDRVEQRFGHLAAVAEAGETREHLESGLLLALSGSECPLELPENVGAGLLRCGGRFGQPRYGSAHDFRPAVPLPERELVVARVAHHAAGEHGHASLAVTALDQDRMIAGLDDDLGVRLGRQVVNPEDARFLLPGKAAQGAAPFAAAASQRQTFGNVDQVVRVEGDGCDLFERGAAVQFAERELAAEEEHRAAASHVVFQPLAQDGTEGAAIDVRDHDQVMRHQLVVAAGEVDQSGAWRSGRSAPPTAPDVVPACRYPCAAVPGQSALDIVVPVP